LTIVNEACWYVIYTKPCREMQVCRYFQSHSFEVFYPTIKVKPADPRSLSTCPYFPRYLFLHVNLDEIGISIIQWVPGAVGLVRFGGQPAALSVEVMST